MAARSERRRRQSIDRQLQKQVDDLLLEVSNDPSFTSGPSDPQELFEVFAKEQVGTCILMIVRISPRLLERLTNRERQVAALIGHGLGNKGIAGRLSITEKRTAHLVEQIKAKWGVSTRAQIARCAVVLS